MFGLDERSASRCKRRRLVMSVSVSVSDGDSVDLVNDDLLLEILLRLPHGRFVIQAGTVCKRWFSLLSEPLFIPRYIQFRGGGCDDYDYTHTILFKSCRCNERVYDLFPPKSKILHGAGGVANNNYLNFFPSTKSVAIKASLKDLLLVSPSYKHYCICNTLTKQCVPLPDPPEGRYERCGFFMYDERPTDYSQFCYKVLLILNVSENDNKFVFQGAIFCSETGKWGRSTFSSCPLTSAPEFEIWDRSFVQGNNGILYCTLRGGDDEIRGFAAFDLSTNGGGSNTRDGGGGDRIRCRFIHLPVNFAGGWQACLERICTGVVRGRLWLSQLLKTNQNFFLKVWELNHDSNKNKNNDLKWLLVHEVRLESRSEKDRMFVAAFHPNNGDVIYMFCDRDLYKYKIGEGEYKKVGQFADPKYPESVADELTRYFDKFTLVHSSFPTLIPALPSI